MTLNDVQRKQVEENMGLVGKVIKDRVHGMNGLGIYTYDDLFQIGCIGLCKAAATDKGAAFRPTPTGLSGMRSAPHSYMPTAARVRRFPLSRRC